MPGIRLFTRANIATESTYGTPVAPTRQLYMDGDGMWDEEIGLNFHETENRGIRTRSARQPTQTTEQTTITLKTLSGIGYDELAILFAEFNGTATGTGAGADKTWTQTPGMTGSNSPKSFTLDIGDDVQNWRLQGVGFKQYKISAARNDVTQLEATGFAQRSIKTAAATPAISTPIKIPGDLWTVKFAASIAALTGASISTNLLLAWDLTVTTGLVLRDYMDGNLYGSQMVESEPIEATLNLTVESTATTISEFYDKYKAQTLDFVRLKAVGPTLGSSNYSSQIDMPIYWDNPETISSEEDGINLYKIPGHLEYDSTSAKSIQLITVASLTALP